jgi:hypothetical protein
MEESIYALLPRQEEVLPKPAMHRSQVGVVLWRARSLLRSRCRLVQFASLPDCCCCCCLLLPRPPLSACVHSMPAP